MAASYIGNAQGTGAANPTTGEFTVHASTSKGDLVIAQWYSRASTKTFTNTDSINVVIDVNTANGGHLVVGWWIAASNADSKTWDGSSVSNGSTGWGTSTFRGGKGTSPFTYSANAAGGSNSNPDPPSCSSTSGDMMLCGFGHMDDWGTMAVPTSPAYTDAGWWETTLGTDAAGGIAYDLDGGTGSAVNPSTFGTATAANYWYAWTASIGVQPAPAVTSLDVTSGSTAGGTTVVITGTAFHGATAVTIGGHAATSFNVTSDTTISMVTAAHAAEANLQVQVTGPGGSSADVAGDNYTYAAAATSFDPFGMSGYFGM